MKTLKTSLLFFITIHFFNHANLLDTYKNNVKKTRSIIKKKFKKNFSKLKKNLPQEMNRELAAKLMLLSIITLIPSAWYLTSGKKEIEKIADRAPNLSLETRVESNELINILGQPEEEVVWPTKAKVTWNNHFNHNDIKNRLKMMGQDAKDKKAEKNAMLEQLKKDQTPTTATQENKYRQKRKTANSNKQLTFNVIKNMIHSNDKKKLEQLNEIPENTFILMTKSEWSI